MKSVIAFALGTVIKKIIYFRYKSLFNTLINADEFQEIAQKNILKTNLNSFYFKKYKVKELTDWQQLPMVEYEDIEPYILDMIEKGINNLTTQKIVAYSQSSGTTKSRKWIPQSLEYIHTNYKAGINMLTLFLYSYPNSNITKGFNFSLTGSLSKKNGKIIGDISALIAYFLPSFFSIFKVPNKKISIINNWEEKLELYINIIPTKDIRWIAGVPSWIYKVTHLCYNKKEKIWKNLEVFFYGGTALGMFKEKLCNLISNNLIFWQNYNASEGFFASQYSKDSDIMVLFPHLGVYFEFIDYKTKKLIKWKNLTIGNIYELVISNKCGLYRYKIGDLIKIEAQNPLRISLAGRSNYCINAFGEELMHSNVVLALEKLKIDKQIEISHYTIAPNFVNNIGYHQWLIVGNWEKSKLEEIKKLLDIELQNQNNDYKSKRYNNLIMKELEIIQISIISFEKWIQRYRNYSVQSKVPIMSNNMDIINQILNI